TPSGRPWSASWSARLPSRSPSPAPGCTPRTWSRSSRRSSSERPNRHGGHRVFESMAIGTRTIGRTMSRIGLGRHGRIADNAGDPLDGLVNLFDIGIVLAVAFLIAGLTLTVNPGSGKVERRRSGAAGARVRVFAPPSGGRRARGRGTPVGTAYRL